MAPVDVFQEKVGLVAIPVAPSVGEERVGGRGVWAIRDTLKLIK